MRLSFALLPASCVLLFTGCSAAPSFQSSSPISSSIQGPALQGKVHGGQNPITGAKVYLYAMATSGYGEASTSLLNSPGYVTTDSNGNFSITSDYTCTAGQQVYIYANGGNPGLAGGTNNTAAGLLAGLGSCTALQTSLPFIFVDEVSTVATAYALAGYATDATHISSSSSTLAATGVANALSSIANLETLGTGAALATTPVANGGNGTVPQSEINTLANILAACINTTGSVASGQPCNTLFTNALSGGTTGTQPTNTANAAINIAHNPAANISNLIALQGSSPPFVPDLSATPTPNDFTIAISYIGGGISGPDGLAIDGSGNVWVANANSNPASITEFSTVGKPLSGSSGYTGAGLSSPAGVAIDGTGNVWVANENNSISKLNATGGAISSSSGYTGSTCLTGDAINNFVIDASGNVWIANGDTSTNVICKFNSSGSLVSTSGYTTSGLNVPTGLAIDISGNVWVGGNPQALAGSGISEFTPSGSSGTWSASSPITDGGLNQPEALAFDASGNLWAANYLDPGSLSKFNSSGTANGSSPFTGGGMSFPVGLVIDGAGNLWTANQGGGISELSSSGVAITGANGYQGGGLVGPSLLAIDGSGNIWVSNPVNGSNLTDAVVEFVGVASPVVTPVVANLLAPYGSAAVNKP